MFGLLERTNRQPATTASMQERYPSGPFQVLSANAEIDSVFRCIIEMRTFFELTARNNTMPRLVPIVELDAEQRSFMVASMSGYDPNLFIASDESVNFCTIYHGLPLMFSTYLSSQEAGVDLTGYWFKLPEVMYYMQMRNCMRVMIIREAVNLSLIDPSLEIAKVIDISQDGLRLVLEGHWLSESLRVGQRFPAAINFDSHRTLQAVCEVRHFFFTNQGVEVGVALVSINSEDTRYLAQWVMNAQRRLLRLVRP